MPSDPAVAHLLEEVSCRRPGCAHPWSGHGVEGCTSCGCAGFRWVQAVAPAHGYDSPPQHSGR